jgi:Predicted membrane protein/domain
MNWYYAINGQRQGPVLQQELEKLVSTGVITEQTLVWREGMTDWKSFGDVRSSGLLSGGTTEDTAVCVVSGKTFPKREMIQFEGKWVSAQHRDEFFQRMRQGMAPVGEGLVPGPYGYGGFWQRFVAKFVDGIILAVVLVPLNMMMSVALLGAVSVDPEAGGGAVGLAAILLFQLLTMIVNIGLGLIYSLFFVRKYQATPGKMAMGLKLVRSDGSHLSKGRIIGRHFGEMLSQMILNIGYIIAAFDSEKKSLHDMICDTRVIKTR